jgi:hypothetical protein
MSELTAQARINNEIASPNDKIYFYTPTDTSAVQLTVRQQKVIINNAFAFTISLPPVAEAKGLTYDITVLTSTAAVTVSNYGYSTTGDSYGWTDITLDAAGERTQLYSDGTRWIETEAKYS